MPAMSRLTALACSLLITGAAARADAVTDFYRGRTITMVIGSEPGGTYDLYARTIARYLGAHLPGAPNVITQNMIGAAGLLAAGHVYNVAPQDGTVIAGLASTMPFRPLVDPIAAQKLNPQRANWMPSPSSYGVVMLVRSDVPVKTVEDMKTHEVVMAGIAPGQLNTILIGATNAALGTKIKTIMGHPSFNASMLALDRGEIDGYPSAPYDAIKRMYSKQMAEGKYRILLQFGGAASPDYPDAPLASDLIKDPEDRMLMELAMDSMRAGYVFMMGPDVPPERVQAMRAAFMDTFHDPAFRADATRQLLAVDPVRGGDIDALVRQAYAMPPKVIERMRAIFASGR